MDSDHIITPFGWDSTAAQVIAGIDLAGQRAIVTGGSSGIGVETARALASANADVTLAVRDLAAGQRARQCTHRSREIPPHRWEVAHCPGPLVAA